ELAPGDRLVAARDGRPIAISLGQIRDHGAERSLIRHGAYCATSVGRGSMTTAARFIATHASAIHTQNPEAMINGETPRQQNPASTSAVRNTTPSSIAQNATRRSFGHGSGRASSTGMRWKV